MSKKKRDIVYVAPYEFAKAIEKTPVVQKLTLPLPVLSQEGTIFGIMVNDLHTPWGHITASFPVQWPEHTFGNPEPVTPITFTEKWHSDFEIDTEDEFLVNRILNRAGLYSPKILSDFEDTRTPCFIGVKTEKCRENEAFLINESTEDPIRDMLYVPRKMREWVRETDEGFYVPTHILDEHDVYWR